MNFPHIYFYWKARNRDINISKKCNNHLTNTGAQQKNIIKMNKAKSWHKDIDQKNNLYSHQKNKMKKKKCMYCYRRHKYYMWIFCIVYLFWENVHPCWVHVLQWQNMMKYVAVFCWRTKNRLVPLMFSLWQLQISLCVNYQPDWSWSSSPVGLCANVRINERSFATKCTCFSSYMRIKILWNAIIITFKLHRSSCLGYTNCILFNLSSLTFVTFLYAF